MGKPGSSRQKIAAKESALIRQKSLVLRSHVCNKPQDSIRHNHKCTFNSARVNKAFEDLEDLSEYSQSSCPSGSVLSYVHDNPCHYPTSSFDLHGLSEILQNHSADAFAMSTESFLDAESENSDSWAAHQNMYYDSEDIDQSVECTQQPEIFIADDINVNLTLLPMEGQEGNGSAPIWPLHRPETIPTVEGQLNMHSPESFLHIDTMKIFLALDDEDMESSEIELIKLQPVPAYESSAGNIFCLHRKSLLRYELPYEEQPVANNTDVHSSGDSEEIEPCGERKLLKLNRGTPDEVDLEKFGIMQNPNWGVLSIRNILKNAESVTVHEVNKPSTDVENEYDELRESAGLVYQEGSILHLLNHENSREGFPARDNSLLREHAVSTLHKWFSDHAGFPFSKKEKKVDLICETGLNLTEVLY